jgi:hypothetical protein
MPSERFGRRERARLEALRDRAPPPRNLSWIDVARIGHERLWWAMRSVDREGLMELFVRALDEVPTARLERVLRDYFRPGDVGAPQTDPPIGIRGDVDKLCSLAEDGHFYEVIAYRGSEQSRGTQEFVARFNVALDRCVAAQTDTSPMDLRVAIEKLMTLVHQIDECQKEIVYFTDEAGSWQIGAVWDRVLPVYFDCLAQTAAVAEYRAAVDAAIADFGSHVGMARGELKLIADEAWESRHKT